MDLSTTSRVCFFVLVQIYLLGKVVPCDLSSGKMLECGQSVSSKNQCPRQTCCFDTSKNPSCFFQENAYGPIRSSKGLCVNVKDGSHADGTHLVWSADCTSSDAFFLVSHDHPPFHVASGKCVLPSNSNFSNPGENVNLVLSSGEYCKKNTVTYRLNPNGNLEYYYLLNQYDLCIESEFTSGMSGPGDVYIRKSECRVDKPCNLSYVYQRKFSEGKTADFMCESCSTIQVIWSNYGVQVKGKYPLVISSSECVTNTSTSVMQKKCNGNKWCRFTVSDSDFSVQSPCSKSSKILLVRYTCKVDAVPAAPKTLNVIAKGQNDLFVEWSIDDNDAMNKFQICWKLTTKTVTRCNNEVKTESLLSFTISSLQPAAKYNITVAQFSSDGKTTGEKRHKVAITRSAALKASGKKSANSFEILLGALQDDDLYVQIVVSKLQSVVTSTTYPGLSELEAYDKDKSGPYIAAVLDKTSVTSDRIFTVGDGENYKRSSARKRRSTEFQNVKLEPETFYSVFQRTFKRDDLYYDSDWMNVVKTAKQIITKSDEPTRDSTSIKSGGGGPVSESQDSGGGISPGIIGAAAGGALLLIILVILVIIFMRRRRRDNSSNSNLYDKPVKYKHSKRNNSLNEVRNHQNNLSLSSEEFEENPNVITAPSGDLYARPIKNKRTENTQHENAVQNETYANMQADIPDEDDSKGVKISRFLFYCDEMKKSENFGFKSEFKELPVGQIHPWDVGKEAKNVPKNRYANAFAYDYSRVILSGEENYINANFIKGIHSEVYIAAQGPTEQTVNDFWRMIWEQDCACIIALTKVVELGKMKCVQYWADEGETAFGEICVKTIKTELFADYVIRYLDMKKDGKGKRVTQYHFISWPDHGVPKYPTKLLAFRHRFRALHTVSAQPIVIHCSAGVGRTGTFIALDITLLRLNQLQEQTINIHVTVNELRNQRVNMVQTLEQYILVHDAVLEMVLCGFTEIEAENLKTEIERLEQKELNKSFTGFELEFKKLASFCHPLAPEECKAALSQKNKSKNRDSNIYPTENLRVFLSGSKTEEDPYINATYVRGYTHARAYIATQMPLSNTINDFWKMVFEKKTVVIVMLNNISEGKTVYPQYWPEDFNQEQQYGDLFVKMVSAETQGPIISRKFVITNKNLKAAVTDHVVRHVQFTDWPEDGVPVNHNDIMELLDTVEEAQQRSVNGAVIVHCSNGAHRTGTYLTLAIERERVRTEHVIDIFRCIKMLREQQPQFVGNVDQYKFCYDAMLTFMESFKTYDNIPKTQKE